MTEVIFEKRSYELPALISTLLAAKVISAGFVSTTFTLAVNVLEFVKPNLDSLPDKISLTG